MTDPGPLSVSLLLFFLGLGMVVYFAEKLVEGVVGTSLVFVAGGYLG